MAGNFCATGVVVPLRCSSRPASGATHALLDAGGRPLLLLRSQVLTLDAFQGRVARVCGVRRGQVWGEAAPVLEVADAVDLSRMPLRPGLDPFARGAVLRTGRLKARLLVGL